MNRAISPEIREVIEAVHYRPAVSLIMPFEPKMNGKEEIAKQLKFACDKIDSQLKAEYPDQIVLLIMLKLNGIIKNLNFNTHKKSVAIFVSPVFEKVLYLDIAVEERIIIDESFEIRDLVYAKKEIHKYLVLVLSGKSSKIFLGNTTTFIKIRSNVPDNLNAYVNDLPGRVANFSDPSEHKEIIIKRFLRQMDEGLGLLLQTYPLPVFVMGPKKILGYFEANSKNEKNVAGWVHGNYEDATESELREHLKPYVTDWKKVNALDLQHQMEKARNAGKLASGIREVWKQAAQHKGRLLIVEKNFMYAAQHGGSDEIIYKAPGLFNKFSYIKDAVDDVIEKVLEHGGDVEFVDEGALSDHHHIALIQYY